MIHDLIQLIAEYGLLFVFVNVLAEQIGLPIPSVPALVIAGSLAMDGKISALDAFGAAFVACMIANAIWYVAGWYYGRSTLKLLCRISVSPDYCVRQTEVRFGRWGGLTLVLAKFFPGLSTIAPPLAGAMRLGRIRFLLLNGLGIAIWAAVAIGAGMLFHLEISHLILLLDEFEIAAVEVIFTLLALYIATKWWKRRRFYRMLRVARITVDELHRLFDQGQKPVVVDVRSSISRDQDPRFIPGALAMDIAEIDKRLEQLPIDREIIFYCTCPNEASAAFVAKKLITLGYTRVRPLQGGLDAWIKAGFEIEHQSGVLGRVAPVSGVLPA
ncbi:MAG TPA: DedA family protein/thiosulfate sulfurtransferase GlpE [Burkholderiales bacterium]|nr:DedA family protein/thiosulfate sulfurtransferase GlpE [Burkholderiales bacterium]